MELSTKVTIHEPVLRLEHYHPVMFLGSCFATSIGHRFIKGKFPSVVNPFGVIYNPYSVASATGFLISDDPIPETALVEHDGLWHSFYHHSTFSAETKSALLQKIEEERLRASEFLKSAEWLFITFGTSWVFEHQQTGLIVSNCHKIPSVQFNRYRLNQDEIVSQYKDLLVKLNVFNPALKVVFTVSPVRHWKDGAHGNQLSKAVLLLAVEQLCEWFDSASYFPSYEIVMDELRDYRFYASDMFHMNEQAVEYIWQRFAEKWLSREAVQLVKKVEDIIKAVEHKPFNPNSEAYIAFLENVLQKAHDLENRFPHLDFYAEKRILNDRLSQV
ncbi:GSCFA domain-containing protein [Saccharicrinis sp. FJH54]|uniref:GSCFA domain-containing protein n=1 Tax=Saccharicrinis sp. FJH54 TaxID=3344665 RepID=UPI0035D46D0B